MRSPLPTYLKGLRHFTDHAKAHSQHYFSRPGKDFTRTRILHLERVVWLSISLLKSTLCVELDQFFSWLDKGETSPTKSALTQARQKLLPRFFKDMFMLSVSLFDQCYKIKRWKGMRLWASDGTGFGLPQEEWLGDEFGWAFNQHGAVVSGRILACYDLLNQLITAVQFHTNQVSELVVAMRSIKQIPSDVLMVYDRGFASHIVPFLHTHFGSNCVIRLPLGFNTGTKSFVKSGLKEQIITEKLSPKARKSLRELGMDSLVRTKITYRLIRVILPNGQTEVLLTTLMDQKRFKHTYFAEVYRKRWAIESCFFVLKSFFQFANFSAYTVNNCWQDIYAHFILYNIQTALFTAKQTEIKKINQRRQHDYKPNRNIIAGLLKRFLVKFTLRPFKELKHWLHDFYRQMFQTMEPDRPDKSKVRAKTPNIRTARHVHEKNYRPAL